MLPLAFFKFKLKFNLKSWCLGLGTRFYNINLHRNTHPHLPSREGVCFLFSGSSLSSFSFPASFPSPKGWKLHFYLIVIPHLMRNLLVSCHSPLDAESVHTFSYHQHRNTHPHLPSREGVCFLFSSSSSSSSLDYHSIK